MRRLAGILAAALLSAVPSSSRAEHPAFAAERERARREPFPADLGPDRLSDEDLKALPSDLQTVYKNVFLLKCTQCHSAARPLNAPFVEPAGGRPERLAAVERWRAEHPGWFEGDAVWNIDESVWQRYVRRMAAKPGAGISQEDAKEIWRFLVADSLRRKTGERAEAWRRHRKKLLDEFKSKHPERYRVLHGGT